MTNHIRSLTVFLGANTGNDPCYAKAARHLGRWMVDHHLRLIYGGGQFGLMGMLAKTVLNNGGQVTGIITRQLRTRHVELAGLTKSIQTANMEERKTQLIAQGDGILAFPGGIGTLEEFSAAASASNLGNNAKPIALYNLNGYYDALQEALRTMVKTGFFSESFYNALDFDDDLDAIYQFMVHYQAPKLRTYR